MTIKLAVNTVASARLTVEKQHLATNISCESQDRFPPVFATAQMVALMEIAAARILYPVLESNELSVGVFVQVSHTAATSWGAKVTANAQYIGQEDKLFIFKVWAEDLGGEIGCGVHKRAVVNVDRLLTGAARRNAG